MTLPDGPALRADDYFDLGSLMRTRKQTRSGRSFEWIGALGHHMDPEERLWFLEQAVTAFVTYSMDNEDLAVVDVNNGYQYVWLLKRLGWIDAAVGSREWFCRRPLSSQAVARVKELGFQQDAIMRDFIREGLPADSVMLSRLVERLFLCAYELAPDYAVRASFKNKTAAESLEALMRTNG